jgi:hypothetical protein
MEPRDTYLSDNWHRYHPANETNDSIIRIAQENGGYVSIYITSKYGPGSATTSSASFTSKADALALVDALYKHIESNHWSHD